MPNPDLTADFFVRLNSGQESAAGQVDRLFRERLCSLVEREMSRRFTARESSEDAVQLAMRSFCRGIDEKRFRIDSSCGFWSLLEQVVRCKILKRAGYDGALKRSTSSERATEKTTLSATEPRPEVVAAIVDLIDEVLSGLDKRSTEVFRLRLQGCTRAEIAKRLNCTETSVRVKLQRIRDRLRRQLANESEM